MNSISLDVIRNILKRDIAHYKPSNASIKANYSDLMYVSPSQVELTQILNELSGSIPDISQYSGELFDCDDFSYVLKGQASLYGLTNKLQYSLAIGLAWGEFGWRNEFHAINWAIIDNSRLLWIEPQDLVIDKGWGLHNVTECRGNLRTIIL